MRTLKINEAVIESIVNLRDRFQADLALLPDPCIIDDDGEEAASQTDLECRAARVKLKAVISCLESALWICSREQTSVVDLGNSVGGTRADEPHGELSGGE